ncbi:MAG: transporter substrate-binding domain-containing protein [Agarilytica sp.]
MHKLLCSLIIASSILCLSCAKNESETTKSANYEALAPTPTPYIYTGDIEGIRQHKQLRIIAPRFDGADALPRSGLSVLTYQNLAAEFARELSLEVKWVFVDGFEEMIPALESGKGDIIVTNMTVTRKRSKRVHFSKPIAHVSEVVIAKKTADIPNAESLATHTIAVPSGTVYIDTLEKLGLTDVTTPLDTTVSDVETLELVESGQYDATILDSDVARTLLTQLPDLSIKFKANKHRPIAWAVRKTSPELLSLLNEFLVSHHVKEASTVFEKRDWSAIKASGQLRMLTLNNPASYFMWRGELMGFDYELMKVFTEQHDLHLAVVIKDSIDELIDALKNGEGDLIAASFTRSSDRVDQGLVFSNAYLKVKEQIVGSNVGPVISDVSELNGKSVGLNPQTVFFERLKEILPTPNEVNIIEVPEATTEELINKVVEGEFDFTVADSHLVSLEETYHENITAHVDLTQGSEIAWGARPDQTQLITELNTYITREYRGLFYNIIFDKYFKNTRKIKRYQNERVVSGTDLSPFDDIIKPLAQKYNMDWRLIVAQMYQESKFQPGAKSFAGAEGLMQVMPRTAKEMGYSDLYNPHNGLAAGIAYLDWLEDRFPGELDFQERLFFTLAAYNAGAGHVRDARKLAKQLGLDANKWFGNVENAMLLLSQPKYYKKSRFGYVRGREPVEYVQRIHDRYLGYVQMTEQSTQ